MTLRRAAIVAPIRTAVGKFGGSLSSITAGDLGAVILKALIERTKIDPARVDDVVFSQGWDVVSWAQDMIGVPDQKISFQTLPVVRYATVDDQDVNIIDPVAIRTEVQHAFDVPVAAPAPSSSDTSQSGGSQSGASSSDSGSFVVKCAR